MLYSVDVVVVEFDFVAVWNDSVVVCDYGVDD